MSKLAWENEKKLLEAYYVRWKECMDECRNLQNDSLSIWEISLYQKYMIGLKHEIMQQSDKLRKCVKEMDEQRDILLGARKDRKIMEKLNENHLLEYSRQAAKKEQRFLDDVATQRFIYNSGSNRRVTSED